MNSNLIWGDSNAEFIILIRIIRIAIIRLCRTITVERPRLSGRILIITKLLVANAYGFVGIDNEENFIYIFGLEFFAVCSRFKWYCFLQRSYIGRSYGNKLDPASSCKRYFIFNIAFNILWDALAPLWKKIYLKLEVNQEDVDKLRDSIFAFLKKGEISPEKLRQHLKYLIIAEVVLWCIFIIYLFVSRSTAI